MKENHNGWQVKSLGEVADIITGGTPSTDIKEYWDEGTIPWLNSGELNQGMITTTSNFITSLGLKNSVAKLMPSDTVLIALTGATTGKVGYLTFQACANQSVTGILPSNQHFPKYLYYYLQTLREHILNISWGGAQKHINQKFVKDLKIPLPPVQIQKQIAEILERADEAKQKRKEANKLTDEFLQSVFIEMFGDPVKNPKGWDIVKVDDISSRVTSGSTPLGGDSNYLSEGILFIRSQNILMNKIDYSDIVFISEDIHKKMLRTWVKKNDVLFNITGASIGRVAYYEGEDNSANVNQHVCIIRTIKEKVNHIFLSYLISSESFQSRVISQNAGATRQAFNFEQIKNFKTICPPLPLQQQFAEIVNKTEALKEKQKQSEQELENLFQSLMQRAFKGELVS